jgi:hypothetical protein
MIDKNFSVPPGFKLDSKGRFLRKPMSHWRTQARRLLMDCLVRAANIDKRGIVGAMVAERLEQIALSEDPEMYVEVLEEVDRYHANMARAISFFLPDPPKKKKKRVIGRRAASKH